MPTTTIPTSTSTVTLTKPVPSSTRMQIAFSGTFTGFTYTIQGSYDGVNYGPIASIRRDQNLVVNGGTGISPTNSTPFLVDVPCEGMAGVQVVPSALASGTVNVFYQEGSYIGNQLPTPSNVSSSLNGTVATTITVASANAFAVGANGTTNPVFNVNSNTSSVATGITVVGAAAGSGVQILATSSGNGENVTTQGSAGSGATAGGAAIILGGSAGATSAGGAAQVTGAAGGATSGTGGAATILAGAGTAGNAAGGVASVTSGAGQGTGAGGAVTVTAGASGAGATGNGGAASLTAGAALSTNGTGGASSLIGGVATGTGTGGAITITSGASGGASGTAGAVNIDNGSKAGGTAGIVSIGGTNAAGVYLNRGPKVAAIIGMTISSLGTTQSSTPTSAQLLGGIVTQTGSTGAGNITLPTGTALSAAMPAGSAAVGDAFDVWFVNVGGGQTLTLTGATGTTVSGTVAIPSAKFAVARFINTGSNTWNIYTTVSA
jgi:hypothetical protein